MGYDKCISRRVGRFHANSDSELFVGIEKLLSAAHHRL
jgi:hypothetical protein